MQHRFKIYTPAARNDYLAVFITYQGVEGIIGFASSPNDARMRIHCFEDDVAEEPVTYANAIKNYEIRCWMTIPGFQFSGFWQTVKTIPVTGSVNPNNKARRRAV